MYPSGLDEDRVRSWKGIFFQSVITGVLTGGLKELPKTLLIGLVAIPVINTVIPLISRNCASLRDLVIRQLSHALQERVHAFGKRMNEEQGKLATVAHTAIIGDSLTLNLGSLFFIPASSTSEIYVFDNNRVLIKVDLNQIETLTCSRNRKRLLKLCRFIVNFKAKLHLDTAYTPMNVSIVYLVASNFFRGNRSIVLERGSMALILLTGTGLVLKSIAWKKNPQALLKSLEEATKESSKIAQVQGSLERRVSSNPKAPVITQLPRLPPECVAHILSYLPREKIDPIARHNGYWRIICYPMQKSYLSSLFGKELTNALGHWLAFAPWIDLKTTLVSNSSVRSDPTGTLYRDSLQYLVIEDNTFALEGIRTFTGRQNLIGWPMSDCLDIRLINGMRKVVTPWFMPAVVKEGNDATSLLYFIEPSDLKNHKIVKFKDAAGRYGVAFQYIFRCQIDGKAMEIPGIAILHQLMPGQPEYIWLENQSIYQGCTEKGQYVLKNSEKILNLEGSQQRNFLFSYASNAEATKNHLEWLTKFVSGQTCGPLFFGQEMQGQPFGTLTFETKNSSLVQLFQKFYSSKKY